MEYSGTRPIGDILKERNIEIVGADPITRHGFTQVPNFILTKKDISVGAKLTYAMLLKYAWGDNACFPGLAALNAACVELSIELADAETIPDMSFRSAANARYKCLIEPYANGSAGGKICVVFDFAKLRGRVVDRQVKMSKAP